MNPLHHVFSAMQDPDPEVRATAISRFATALVLSIRSTADKGGQWPDWMKVSVILSAGESSGGATELSKEDFLRIATMDCLVYNVVRDKPS